jgi:ferrous iron transport protein B
LNGTGRAKAESWYRVENRYQLCCTEGPSRPMNACHALPTANFDPEGCIALVGHQNVGKSVIFHHLTGVYVTVANYPGTTVEVARGKARDTGATVVDTPGIVTLPPQTADEWTTARVLFREKLRSLIQVGDAKNLGRTLLLTAPLAELGVPMVLVLNMMDEAKSRGLDLDVRQLEARMGLPVVPAVAIRGEGIPHLAEHLQSPRAPGFRLKYSDAVETAAAEVAALLPEDGIAPRGLALAWLTCDPSAEEWFRAELPKELVESLEAIRETAQMAEVEPLSTVVQAARLDFAESTARAVRAETEGQSRLWGVRLGHLAGHPVWGIPLLLAVLYAVYWFVGQFGASTLVGLMEEDLFGGVLNPWVTEQVRRWSPVPFVTDLLVGEYGLWTVGMTYALALIFPIVTTFFFTFGILEDSGYLSRLVVLSNRLFRTLGLNGKAVLPMVLGLGCVTMATLTTRILESRRERLMVTFLLALAVPCSAQLGVVMGMLGRVSLAATVIWAGFVGLVLLLVGWLAARVLPGERTPLLIALAPLRVPVLGNVLTKTFARLEWYLKEVVPLFLFGTFLLFALDRLGALPWLVEAGKPLVRDWLGLPAEASAAFLMGFLRRDFGATGLFALESANLLSPRQAVVGMVTITLFIPCIASIMIIVKEHGRRTALSMLALIFPLAFLVGGLLNRGLLALGWGGP